MGEDLIEKSKETGELQLDFRDKLTHFSIVIFSFAFAVFVPLMVLFYQLIDPVGIKNYGVLWFSPIFAAVGIIFYYIQKKRLKLTSIKTNISKGDFDKLIEKISDKYRWQILTNTSKVIIAKTPFSGSSWGEQITIIFGGDSLLVNSICDPDKRTSVVSYGRNAQNVRLIIKRINRFSKTTSFNET